MLVRLICLCLALRSGPATPFDVTYAAGRIEDYVRKGER